MSNDKDKLKLIENELKFQSHFQWEIIENGLKIEKGIESGLKLN